MLEEFSQIKQIFQEERDKLKERIAYGNCDSFDEYKFFVGIHEGLTQAEQMLDNYVNNVLKALEDDDNGEF